MPGFWIDTSGKWAVRGVVCWMRSYHLTRLRYTAAWPEGKFFCGHAWRFRLMHAKADACAAA